MPIKKEYHISKEQYFNRDRPNRGLNQDVIDEVYLSISDETGIFLYEASLEWLRRAGGVRICRLEILDDSWGMLRAISAVFDELGRLEKDDTEASVPNVIAILERHGFTDATTYVDPAAKPYDVGVLCPACQEWIIAAHVPLSHDPYTLDMACARCGTNFKATARVGKTPPEAEHTLIIVNIPAVPTTRRKA